MNNKTYETDFSLDSEILYKKICGVNDVNIASIEKLTSTSIIPRGTSFIIKGEREKVDKIISLFHELADYIHFQEKNYELQDHDLRFVCELINSGGNLRLADILNLRIRINDSGKTIIPRSLNQGMYVNSILNRPVTFGIGPAGTGKTYLAVAAAVSALLRGKTEKIILTRPAVEAGENLGFLPGDLAQKINPYLRPLYDALFDIISMEKTSKLLESGRIEIAPLAYMRGRTLNNSCVILDEAQNTTLSQMKMFLTRLGVNSRMVISGDVTQIDLEGNRKSGLIQARKILVGIPEIAFIEFDKNDICRHPVVEKIVNAYDRAGIDG